MLVLREAFDKAREKTKQAYAYTDELIKTTPIEVFAVGALGMMVAGGFSYSSESGKAGQRPLGFSEIGQMELYVETIGGHKIPPLTRFYAENNDCTMKIFEAYNIAHNRWGGGDERIAYELEKKIAPTMKFHSRDLNDCAEKIPGYAKEALAAVGKLSDANKDLQPVIDALDRAWVDTHDHRYKTVYYTSCDSKGKCSLRSRREYSHTIHSYRYYPEHGRRAAELMQGFVAKYPDLKISEIMLKAVRTGAENEYGIRESRKLLPGYTPPTAEDYLRYANTWATGSNYQVLTPVIDKDHESLKERTPEWNAAKETASSTSYRTFSRYDSGPREFRIGEKALDHAQDISENIGRITGGMEYAAREIPALRDKIQQFVDAELHHAKADANVYSGDIITTAENVYTKNYAGGFNPYPYNWLAFTLWSMLGAALGAAAGFGLDQYGNYRNMRDRATTFARNGYTTHGLKKGPDREP